VKKSLRAAVLALSALAASAAVLAAGENEATPRKVIPGAFVEADTETLKTIVDGLKTRRVELGCREMPKTPRHPPVKKAPQPTTDARSKEPHAAAARQPLRDSVFFGCEGGELVTQKFLAAAQEAARQALETHPGALIQVGTVLVKPSVFLATPCNTTCPSSTGPKAGWRSGGLCFYCSR